MRTRLLLISGFLGSGKTSFLRHWLQELKAPQEKASLIVNEIGKINLDAQLLSKYSPDVLRLLSGCLCCSSKEELLRGLRRMLDEPAGGTKPDWIAIESSGLAEPAESVDSLVHPLVRREADLAGVVCLVDASRVESLRLQSPLIEKQISYASLILMNKKDLCQGPREKVEKLVRTWNGSASLVWVEEGRLSRQDWESELTQPILLRSRSQPRTEAISFRDYYALDFEVGGSCQEEDLKTWLAKLPANVERVKGFLKLSDGRGVLVQMVGGTARLHPWNEEDLPSQISLIGKDLASDQLPPMKELGLKLLP